MSRTSIVAVVLVFSSGCASVVGEEFEGYVTKPTHCDLALAQGGNPQHHLQCASNETCLPAAADGSASTSEARCWPVRTYGEESAACQFTNDCGVNGFCSAAGCLSYCRVGGASSCADGAECLAFIPEDLVIDGISYGYCAPRSCDPLGDACGKERTCQFHQTTLTACFFQSGQTPAGEACESSNDCMHGLTCGPKNRCTKYCRLDGDDCGGKRCIPDDEELSFGGTGYGYCEQTR